VIVDKRAGYLAIGLGTAAVIAAGIVVPHVVPASAAASDRFAVAAGTDSCGTGWPAAGTDATSGTQVFRITNTSTAGLEVQLENPSTGAVFLDVEGLGMGATQDYRVRLGAGSYRFKCLPADGTAITGATVRVAGDTHVADATPGVVPVTRNDLIPASQQYGTWIEGRLPILEQDVQRLASDIAGGDRTAAEHDWLTGHLEYEQLGAAYGAFGDDDTAINGTPASGKTALDDPDLTGFHKIEALLWSNAPMPSISGQADKLVAAVQHLRTTFPTARIDPLDIGLRAHEILENALQFEATGKTDAGSHTNLATISANIAGTHEALDPIRGILQTRYPQLGATERSLDSLDTLVMSYRHADGSWEPLDSLTQTQREQLDAHMDASLELLANVATICDIRRTS
jgi:iron uptake system component EfeO